MLDVHFAHLTIIQPSTSKNYPAWTELKSLTHWPTPADITALTALDLSPRSMEGAHAVDQSIKCFIWSEPESLRPNPTRIPLRSMMRPVYKP